MSINGTVRKVRSFANDVDMDDILEMMGLERRRGFVAMMLPTIGLLATGAIIGAGLGMFFGPPRKLQQMNNELKSRARNFKKGLRSHDEIHDDNVGYTNDLETARQNNAVSSGL